MNTATAVTLLLVIIVIIGVIYCIYSDRKAGRNSCGCSTSCNACSGCGPVSDGPNVAIDLGDEKAENDVPADEETSDKDE